MSKKISFILVAVFATLIALYPVQYFILERTFGLLQSKSPELLKDTLWNIAFYIHIVFSGIALLVGWSQFVTRLRTQRLKLHRLVGKIYILSALTGAVAGIYIAFYATGGWLNALGFICLGVIWFYTTLKAYLAIRQKEVSLHQRMMIYSYAACFAAVTLRVYLPILVILLGDFGKAYHVVAWLCWVPNMIVAYILVRKIKEQRGRVAIGL